MLTCYDVLSARMLERAEIDMLLVGDTLGQVVLGYDSTLPVTLDEMIHHAKAVRRGAPDTFVVVDLPFMAYQVSSEDALRSAGRVMKETGANAVKLEGGDREACDAVQRLARAGIPVMGHVGFGPQSVNAEGRPRVQGRDEESAQRLLRQAIDLADAGCFSIVLELVSAPVAAQVTRRIPVPTIGIGSGASCDGQVLVLPDALGMNPGFTPRFLKTFANLEADARAGVRAYVEEVKARTYPGPEHSFGEKG